MKHLIAAFISALVVGMCLALTLRAIHTDAASFVLLGIAGALFFAFRYWVEARRAWPAFTRHLARRREMRVTAPFTRIKLNKDDLQ